MEPGFVHTVTFRVRYSETDQLGTFYNARALEWFEVGRTELLRAANLPYAHLEAQGVCLPLIEAHVNYRGRARYDDPLVMTSILRQTGKASLRFDVTITHAQDGPRPAPVADGYTVHAITDPQGKPMRCPQWVAQRLASVLETP